MRAVSREKRRHLPRCSKRYNNRMMRKKVGLFLLFFHLSLPPPSFTVLVPYVVLLCLSPLLPFTSPLSLSLSIYIYIYIYIYISFSLYSYIPLSLYPYIPPSLSLSPISFFLFYIYMYLLNRDKREIKVVLKK